jgi:hypothetical protein
MNLQIFYDQILIGDIADAFEDQNTWFGDFSQRVDGQAGRLQQRLSDFIAFSKDWNRRCATSEAYEPSEFEKFSELLTSGLWLTKAPNGAVERLD